MYLAEVALAFAFLSAFVVSLTQWRADVALDAEARQLAEMADAAHGAVQDYLRAYYGELSHCLGQSVAVNAWQRSTGTPGGTDQRAIGDAHGGEATARWLRVPFFNQPAAPARANDLVTWGALSPCRTQTPYPGEGDDADHPRLPGRSVPATATPTNLVYPRPVGAVDTFPAAFGAARHTSAGELLGTRGVRVRVAVRSINHRDRQDAPAPAVPALQAMVVFSAPAAEPLDAELVLRAMRYVRTPDAGVLLSNAPPPGQRLGPYAVAPRDVVYGQGGAWAMPLCVLGPSNRRPVAAAYSSLASTVSLATCASNRDPNATAWRGVPATARPLRGPKGQWALDLGNAPTAAPVLYPVNLQDGTGAYGRQTARLHPGMAAHHAAALLASAGEPFVARGWRAAGTLNTARISQWLTGEVAGDDTASARLVLRIEVAADSALRGVLWRSPVPGLPDANRMETDLDMGGHGIYDLEWLEAEGETGDVTQGVLDVHGPVHFHGPVQIGGGWALTHTPGGGTVSANLPHPVLFVPSTTASVSATANTALLALADDVQRDGGLLVVSPGYTAQLDTWTSAAATVADGRTALAHTVIGGLSPATTFALPEQTGPSAWDTSRGLAVGEALRGAAQQDVTYHCTDDSDDATGAYLCSSTDRSDVPGPGADLTVPCPPGFAGGKLVLTPTGFAHPGGNFTISLTTPGGDSVDLPSIPLAPTGWQVDPADGTDTTGPVADLAGGTVTQPRHDGTVFLTGQRLCRFTGFVDSTP